MICCFILLISAYGSVGYGYDSGADHAACGRPYRSGRKYEPPCDLTKFGFCTSAGKTYPWRAVKQFISDNKGLIRRMYGDQNHGHILRSELQDINLWNTIDEPLSLSRYARYQEDIDVDNNLTYSDDLDVSDNEERFLNVDMTNKDVLNTKFVYSEEPTISIKLAGLKTASHFTTQETVETTATQYNVIEETVDYITEANDISVTTDTTEQIISIKNNVPNSKLEQTDSGSTTSKNYAAGETDTNPNKENKVETILFQDMEDELKKKKPINYNLRGINACPVKEEVVAPFWANNTRGEILALLNMYPFEQYVHWEKCAFENKQMYCKDGCRCEQQFRLHRLLAYDPNNECRGIFSDWFRFPSCCVCKCYDIPVEFRLTSRSPRLQTHL